MAKKTNKSKPVEPDSVYFLKLLFFFILGSIWVLFDPEGESRKLIPVGLLIGLLFAHHDHFNIDRKIEYAVLLIAAFLSYASPVGIVLLI
jgi:hypothetical protein